VIVTSTEMDQASGANSPLSVILPARLNPKCSNLSNWTLVTSQTSFSPRQGFGIALTGGLPLSGTTAFGNTATWLNDIGTLILEVADEILAGQTQVVSFSLQNPTHQQNFSLPISISTTGSATVASEVIKPNQGPLDQAGSFARDSSLLRVGNPSWPIKLIRQSSPYPNAQNNITVNISALVDLTAAGECVITITGLAGTVTDSTAELKLWYLDSVSEAEAVFGQYGVWDRSGTLSLHISAGLTLHAGQSYALSFQVMNSGSQQGAVSVSIGASGSPSIDFAGMDNAEGESAPLLILGGGFSALQIGQSTPWPGARNTISCTIAAIRSLPSGSVLLVSGLVGSSTSDSAALPTTSSPGSAPVQTSGSWQRSHGSLILTLTRDTKQGEEAVFSFQLTNPGVSQAAPTPILAGVWPAALAPPYDATADGAWLVLPQAMEPDSSIPPGIPGAVPGDAAPLRVYSPGFAVATIGQAANSAGSINVVTLTIIPNFNITAARGSRITLSGLLGSETADPQRLFLAGGFDGQAFFNDVHVSSDGHDWSELTASTPWTPREGHALVAQDQTLYVIAGRTVDSQRTQSYLSDVWASPDGLTWSLAAAAPFPARAFFGAVALGPLARHGLLVFGGIAANSSLRLNDVWQSADGGVTWTKLVDKAPWAARYGLAAAFHLMPVTPAGGRHSLYTDSAATPSAIVAFGSACDPGCGKYDATLPGCALLAGDMPQCCARTDECVLRRNLADIWSSPNGGKTWTPLNALAPPAPRTFPFLASLPDGSIAVAAGYSYWDHFTADIQALESTTTGPMWRRVVTNAAGADGLRRAAGKLVVVKGCLVLIGGHSRRDASIYTYYGDVWTTG
jgi:hypothetical protein